MKPGGVDDHVHLVLSAAAVYDAVRFDLGDGVGNEFHVSARCQDALDELTERYHFTPDSNYCMDPQRIVRHGRGELNSEN